LLRFGQPVAQFGELICGRLQPADVTPQNPSTTTATAAAAAHATIGISMP
jgi:hypothetical protein